MQNVGPAVRIDATRASVAGAGARVGWNVALLGGASVTDSVIAKNDGEGASTEIAAVFFPIARQVVHLTTEVRHDVPHTTSPASPCVFPRGRRPKGSHAAFAAPGNTS